MIQSYLKSILVVLLLALLPACGRKSAPHTLREHTWDSATVEALAVLPVQEGGRIKPLSMFASYSLYLVHGRRDMKLDTTGDGKQDLTLSPVEWLLDVWCFPNEAADYPLFRIENVEVLDAIGIEHQGQRFDFDYITYRQMLTPTADGRSPAQRLMQLQDGYRGIPGSQRAPVESHIVNTASRVFAYHDLHQQLAIWQSPFAIEGEALKKLFDGQEQVWLGQLLQRGPQFRALVRELQDGRDEQLVGNAISIAGVLRGLIEDTRGGMAMFPSAAEAEAWNRLVNQDGLVEQSLFVGLDTRQEQMVDHLQRALAADNQPERESEMQAFQKVVVAAAKSRGEYAKIELETEYLAQSWHYQSVHWFLTAMLVVCLGWVWPRAKWLWWGGMGLTAYALSLLVYDVVLRCLIRGRPPILNLYDTFLFIAATGVLSALVAEWITRRRIALSLAPIFGALLVMLARAFEVEEGKDQLAPLIAVLDTNYYLATHVTAINMGYAAGMFAALLGTAWLVLQALGIRRHDTSLHKSIVRATYGVTAFGLTFAVFGTIYGGVWANDSWGRFWGWDPKENGALLICLSQIALLHARMSGWVRDLGFCVWAGITGMVVAFSWFHVNLLEIGLHTYGFAGSTKSALFSYYWIQGGLIGLGAIGVLLRRWLGRVPAVGKVASESPS